MNTKNQTIKAGIHSKKRMRAKLIGATMNKTAKISPVIK